MEGERRRLSSAVICPYLARERRLTEHPPCWPWDIRLSRFSVGPIASPPQSAPLRHVTAASFYENRGRFGLPPFLLLGLSLARPLRCVKRPSEVSPTAAARASERPFQHRPQLVSLLVGAVGRATATGAMWATLLAAAAAAGSLLRLASALSTGAPSEACSTMWPERGGSPQPYNTFPYKITVGKDKANMMAVGRPADLQYSYSIKVNKNCAPSNFKAAIKVFRKAVTSLHGRNSSHAAPPARGQTETGSVVQLHG